MLPTVRGRTQTCLLRRRCASTSTYSASGAAKTSRRTIGRPSLATDNDLPAIEPPDGRHRREYDAAAGQAVLGEAAGLIKALGFASQHVALIGGIVPGLLVPALDPGVEPHIGTTDLDVCLSLAIMEGTTGYYQKIQQTLKNAGFHPTEESWRWRGGGSASVVLEFFCPQPPGHAPGRPFRPPAERRRARANLGSQLSALALEAGAVIGEDVEEIEREVTLPGGAGRQQLTLRVTRPAGFLERGT